MHLCNFTAPNPVVVRVMVLPPFVSLLFIKAKGIELFFAHSCARPPVLPRCCDRLDQSSSFPLYPNKACQVDTVPPLGDQLRHGCDDHDPVLSYKGNALPDWVELATTFELYFFRLFIFARTCSRDPKAVKSKISSKKSRCCAPSLTVWRDINTTLLS